MVLLREVVQCGYQREGLSNESLSPYGKHSMTDPVKKRLSAKEILADIRSGMDASALKKKYGLSDKSLDKVYFKLKQAGLLKKHEKPLPGTSPAPIPSHVKKPKRTEWKCPACGKPQAAEVPECPICGIVVAKYLKRDAPQTNGSTASYISVSPGSSSDRNWTAVIASIVVLGLFGAFLLYWSGYRGQEKTEVASRDVSSEPSSRDQMRKDRPDESEEDPETSSTALPEDTIEDTPISDAALQPLIPPPLEPPPVTVSPPAREKARPKKKARAKPKSTKYVTGVLRRFNYRDFKTEVVEASKTHPVLFQFYSDT